MPLGNSRVVKLRASCDRCNEAKVRCSQAKPQCRRCERQGVACIYGLSRRSHRTAPRVGASQPTPDSCLSSNTRPLFCCYLLGARPSSPTERPHAPHREGCSHQAASVTAQFQGDRFPEVDRVFPASTNDLGVYTSQQVPSFNKVDIQTSLESAFSPMSDLSTTPRNLQGHYMLPPSPMPSSRGDLDNLLTSEAGYRSQDFVDPPCDCNNLISEQLSSLHLPSGEHGTLDSQLSQLKCALKVSEECISCTCVLQNEMSIMTISLLVGRIIEGFEILMARTNLVSSPTHSNIMADSDDSPHGAAVPRLFWGELQIEPDEEAELTYHMLLIQFRKLQVMVKRLGAVVDILGGTQDNSSTGNMACQALHMWLAQKVEGFCVRHRVNYPATIEERSAGLPLRNPQQA